MCVFFRTAGLALVRFLLIANGSSRLQLCWLPTDLTLTPKVNTLFMCVRVFRIYYSICDWLVVTVTYVVGPFSSFTLCVALCNCVRKLVLELTWMCLFGLLCVFSCQQGNLTPIAPHWEILTLSLLDSLHPNMPPSDSPYVTPVLPFCSISSSLFSSFVCLFYYALCLNCLPCVSELLFVKSFCDFHYLHFFIIHFGICKSIHNTAGCLFCLSWWLCMTPNCVRVCSKPSHLHRCKQNCTHACIQPGEFKKSFTSLFKKDSA